MSFQPIFMGTSNLRPDMDIPYRAARARTIPEWILEVKRLSYKSLLCHTRESGYLTTRFRCKIPAFAGMTIRWLIGLSERCERLPGKADFGEVP